jgi:hypothetical protein
MFEIVYKNIRVYGPLGIMREACGLKLQIIARSSLQFACPCLSSWEIDFVPLFCLYNKC